LCPQARVPAAVHLFGIEREGIASGELRRRRPERAANQLAAAAFGLDAEPVAVAAPCTGEIHAQRQPAVDRELVALALLDFEVEATAVLVGVAVLVELEVIEGHCRAEEQVPAAAFPRQAAACGHHRAAPLADDVPLDLIVAYLAGER